MIFADEIQIGNFNINKSSEVFIIAEAGVNHNGDMNMAKKLIDIAAEAGVNAVKFQAFRTEHLILKDVVKAPYQTKTTDSQESQFEMLKKLEVTKEQNLELLNYCKSKGILFLTTPFDEASLDELDELDLPAYKIASTDTTNLPFLKRVAKKGKPILLSTGMSFMSEIELALNEIYPYNKDVILLHCTANYPIDDCEVNLNVINTFKQKFNMLLGYSDHSVGIGAAPYAIPMGVKVLEKHFTLDNSLSGPDHKASLSPAELIEFVKITRKIERYLGTDLKYPTLSETKTRKSLQKNLVANKVIKQGELFTEENIIAKRTGGEGISALYCNNVYGKAAIKDFNKNDIIHV